MSNKIISSVTFPEKSSKDPSSQYDTNQYYLTPNNINQLRNVINNNAACQLDMLSSIIINVKDYGVQGDGITDDSYNFQCAINAAAGKILYVPSGNYRVSGLNINEPVHIMGFEKYKSLLVNATSNIYTFHINFNKLKDSVNSLILENIGFYKSNQLTRNLNVPYVKLYNDNDDINGDSIIRNCVFDSGATALQCINTAFLKIEDCRFQNNYCGILLSATTAEGEDAGDSTINGCTFDNPSSTSIYDTSFGIIHRSSGRIKNQ